MRDSSHLRLFEIRAVFRLLQESRELAVQHPEPGMWQRHMLLGLCELTGARHGLTHLWRGFTPHGQVQLLGLTHAGWAEPKVLGFWAQRMATGRHRDDPVLDRLTHVKSAVQTLTRRQIISDRDYFASPLIDSIVQMCPIRDTLVACQRLDGRGLSSGIALYRLDKDRPFSERQRSMLHLFNEELYRCQRRQRVASNQPVQLLSPRQRQVLAGLLAGDSLKQIAEKLGLSRHTVNDHVKIIHQRLAVSTRGELLAKCLGDHGNRMRDE